MACSPFLVAVEGKRRAFLLAREPGGIDLGQVSELLEVSLKEATWSPPVERLLRQCLQSRHEELSHLTLGDLLRESDQGSGATAESDLGTAG